MVKFVVGDVVRLKSNPQVLMTVSGVTDEFIYTCWFAGEDLKSGTFKILTLVLDRPRSEEKA